MGAFFKSLECQTPEDSEVPVDQHLLRQSGGCRQRRINVGYQAALYWRTHLRRRSLRQFLIPHLSEDIEDIDQKTPFHRMPS